jgi:2-amino-4-hydroxy-6-hydroxymethyldihydropteridine diphosphokinase
MEYEVMMMNNSMHSGQYGRIAYVGIGSNRGERLENLGAALWLLRANDNIAAVTSSPVYETRPIGIAGPGDFLNAVLKIETTMQPFALLEALREIEQALGRSPDRGGPRTIDLDILLYDDLVFSAKSLTIPHPRMHQRGFVLVPFADLAPEVLHPALGLSIGELLEQLPDMSEVRGRIGDVARPIPVPTV